MCGKMVILEYPLENHFCVFYSNILELSKTSHNYVKRNLGLCLWPYSAIQNVPFLFNAKFHVV